VTERTVVPANVRRLICVHALSAVAMGLPWPALLVAVWNDTNSEVWLGAAGAARMAPYVLLSWLAGRMADRMNREWCVRASLVTRTILLLATATLLSVGSVQAAVVTACLTIACGTPAYPAIAAQMPNLAGHASEEATGLLVTVEVGAFFVGPAIGGLALGWGVADAGMYAAPLLMVLALGLMRWVDCGEVASGSSAQPASEPAHGLGRLIARSPDARAGLVAVAINNAVDGLLGIALLPLAVDAWDSGDRGFGLATAALGFGALLAPVLIRLWGIDVSAGRRSALVFAGFLAVVAVSSGLWWALVPIVVIGAVSVHVEAVATTMMQRSVPDQARASLLGLADSVMVAAAAAAAAITPYLTDLVGARTLVVACTVAGGAMAAVLQPTLETVADRRYLAGAISTARR
jgi:MFS family permease